MIRAYERDVFVIKEDERGQYGGTSLKKSLIFNATIDEHVLPPNWWVAILLNHKSIFHIGINTCGYCFFQFLNGVKIK